jgi:hypothetical protein
MGVTNIEPLRDIEEVKTGGPDLPSRARAAQSVPSPEGLSPPTPERLPGGRWSA